MTRRKIYLSGPITGMPDKNHPLFMSVAGLLRSQGHEVYNPREFTWPAGTAFPKRKAFAAYCAYICEQADMIVMLPGWRQSLGATTEHGLAKNCKLDIVEWSDRAEHFDFVPAIDDVGGGP